MKVLDKTWAADGLAEWVDGDTAYLSVVFTWRLEDAYQRALWYRALGYKVRAGGPGTFTRRKFLADVATVAEQGEGIPDAIVRHHPLATIASRGCDQGCWWCIVPKMEGREFQLLPDFTPRPILCDNLAPAMTRRNLWSDDEEARLKALFADQVADSELPAWFPGRTLAAIKYHANKLDLVRRKPKSDEAAAIPTEIEKALPTPAASPAPRRISRAASRPSCETATLDKIIDWLVSKRDIQVAVKDGQYRVNGRIHTTEEELVRAANMHRQAYKLPLFALTVPTAQALQAAAE